MCRATNSQPVQTIHAMPHMPCAAHRFTKTLSRCQGAVDTNTPAQANTPANTPAQANTNGTVRGRLRCRLSVCVDNSRGFLGKGLGGIHSRPSDLKSAASTQRCRDKAQDWGVAMPCSDSRPGGSAVQLEHTQIRPQSTGLLQKMLRPHPSSCTQALGSAHTLIILRPLSVT